MFFEDQPVVARIPVVHPPLGDCGRDFDRSSIDGFPDDLEGIFLLRPLSQRIVFTGDAVMVWFGLGRGISIATHVLTWTFQPEDGGTRLNLAVVVQNPPMWQRAFDRLLDESSQKMFNGRLARIKAATEEQATTAS